MSTRPCINHPTRLAIIECKKCGAPLCADCRVTAQAGVFCSHACADDFDQFQSRIHSSHGVQRKSFSLFGCLRTIIISIVLIAVIWFVLVTWLGTSDPAGMLEELRRMFRLLF